MDIYEKFTVSRTPLRLLTAPEGPLYDPLYKAAEKYFLFPELKGKIGNRMQFNGKEMIVWSLNNYLGLGDHEDLQHIEIEACKKWGLSYPMGARMFSGETTLHRELEEEISSFVHCEATLVFNYAYQGMVSMIDTLLDYKDIVIYDNQCHACIIDGIKMHQGKQFSFQHNDIDNLTKLLERTSKIAENSKGGILIITEGVFGMSGSQGHLKQIVALKEQFNFRLLVDDAHGFGVMGPTGAGTAEAQGVQDGVDLYFSSFSKSIASVGGFVSGTKYAIDFIKYGIRSQMFSAALPAAFLEADLAKLRYLRQHPELRSKVWENSQLLQSGLREMGFDLGTTTTQLTPVFLSCTEIEGAHLMIDLRENFGIFCSGALFPVVPRGVFLLRLSPTAAHTYKDIEDTLFAFKEVMKKLKAGGYQKKLDARVLHDIMGEKIVN